MEHSATVLLFDRDGELAATIAFAGAGYERARQVETPDRLSGRISSRSQNPGARAATFTTRSSRRDFPSASRASSTSAGPSGLGSATRRLGGAFLPLRAAPRQPRRSRSRCAITATSSGCTIRTSAMAAASCSPSFADTDGRLLDLGTKGSGQTPYSRTADGRLTLKGGVREVLATEMLEALGVNTSKTFALFETGEDARARRRAVADPLGGAHPAEPRPYPHRHVPAAGVLRRGRQHRQARSLLPRTSLRRAPGRRCRNALRLFDLVSQRDRDTRRVLSRRGLRPRRAQQRQYQHHRRELRLRPVALHARMGPGVHRGLFRPLRALFLRPPARSDPLGPRPVRRLPDADRRGAAADRPARRAGATASRRR